VGWEDNIKMAHIYLGCENLKRFDLASAHAWCAVSVITLFNIRLMLGGRFQ
jgi:hypothetical protein